MNGYKKIIRCVYHESEIKKIKCVIADIPKSLKYNKIQEYYTGLKCIKNGRVYDDRYGYKDKWIHSPVIICFADKSFVDPFSIHKWIVYDLEDSFKTI
jgi:hypothetical protein